MIQKSSWKNGVCLKSTLDTKATLESCPRINCFILGSDHFEVNNRNMALMLQSNLPVMCTCMCVFDQHSTLLDDVTLHCIKVEPDASFSSREAV